MVQRQTCPHRGVLGGKNLILLRAGQIVGANRVLVRTPSAAASHHALIAEHLHFRLELLQPFLGLKEFHYRHCVLRVQHPRLADSLSRSKGVYPATEPRSGVKIRRADVEGGINKRLHLSAVLLRDRELRDLTAYQFPRVLDGAGGIRSAGFIDGLALRPRRHALICQTRLRDNALNRAGVGPLLVPNLVGRLLGGGGSHPAQQVVRRRWGHFGGCLRLARRDVLHGLGKEAREGTLVLAHLLGWLGETKRV